MSNNNTELQIVNENSALAAVEAEERLFMLAQRRAKVYTTSSMVPKHYQGDRGIGNVIIAENMAKRLGADTLMVMQNLYVVHGSPGWSSKFLIATFNQCGRFSPIRYEMSGEEGTDSWGCRAYATEKETGERVQGVRVTIAMAKAEGWVQKAGSKWKTMPELMLQYRSAAFMIRAVAPEVSMGIGTVEEVEDMAEVASAPSGRAFALLDAGGAQVDRSLSPETPQNAATATDVTEESPEPVETQQETAQEPEDAKTEDSPPPNTAKKKRKRRTKAEIAAAQKAEAEAKAIAEREREQITKPAEQDEQPQLPEGEVPQWEADVQDCEDAIASLDSKPILMKAFGLIEQNPDVPPSEVKRLGEMLNKKCAEIDAKKS